MNSTNARMRQVLVEMTMISEAAAAQLGDVIHGGEKNNAPRGPRRSMAEEHLHAYLRADTRTARRQALTDAEQALIRARIAPRRQYIPGTLEWRVAIARAGGSIEQVSIVYGCSRSTVYRLRALFGGEDDSQQAGDRGGGSVGDDSASGRGGRVGDEPGYRQAAERRVGQGAGTLERAA